MKSGKQINHELEARERTTAGWWHRLGILCLLLAATAVTLPAQTLTTLVNFDGTNGSNPQASVVQGGDGNLYGTTLHGGASDGGTVFKMTPTGTLMTLYSFCARTKCTDGENPEGGVVLATDGNFYGTTGWGGAYYSNGTVFKITPGGTLTTLYSFCAQSNCPDGQLPTASLVQGTDGDLYGITRLGGTYDDGTVFKITRGGTLTTLHTFDYTDGYLPEGPLVQATDGNYYGTTEEGGAHNEGTVFKMTPQGVLSTLYSFCSQANCADGGLPYAGLIQATDGNLYGTTFLGGAYGEGTVFKITRGGTLTTLHSFDVTDGAETWAGLIQATDGDLYGTTSEGGASTACGNPPWAFGCGTVFRITLGGELTTLYSFCSQGGGDCTDGTGPEATMTQATDGNLYGTTLEGGTDTGCFGGCGTVFSLSVGLGPFIETLPTIDPVGAPVRILGTNLTGTTSVTFNGTAATFTVNSMGTAIGTTVPTGATTGTVQVVTPGGTLSSNVPFRVLH